MQIIDISPTASMLDDNKPPKLILLKLIAVASLTVSLLGGIVHVVNSRQPITKAESEQIKPDDGRRELQVPTQPSEAPTAKGEDKVNLSSQTPTPEPQIIVVKKPQQPIIVEEDSEAWFCLQNNGGSGCLNRDRFAPNYRVVEQQKSYNDYLQQYGIKPINNCPPDIAWQPNCQ